MKNLSLLLKPVSSTCNLQCKYCFYHNIAQNRQCSNYGIMDYATLKACIQKIFDENYTSIQFLFQGGEPTLAGLDYYQTLIDYIKHFNTNHIAVSFALQTNAYTLDTEWAKFFQINDFLIGVSLDGTKEIHNVNRITNTGLDTFNRVMKSISILKNHSVKYNIVSVVTKNFAKHIEKIYNFYKENHFQYIQLIPCLDPYKPQTNKQPYSLTPSVYTEFLKKLFDLWYNDILQGNYISISFFENILLLLSGKQATFCGTSGQCVNQMVIEADGSVFPCDFYCLDDYYIGNILQSTFFELQMQGDFSEFVTKSQTKNPDCSFCKWYPLCRGGCKRERIHDQFRFCTSYQEFFSYTYPRFEYISKIFHST